MDAEYLAWIGDGVCDDDTNISECAYDGGDCCLPEVNMDYCSLCECLHFVYVCIKVAILIFDATTTYSFVRVKIRWLLYYRLSVKVYSKIIIMCTYPSPQVSYLFGFFLEFEPHFPSVPSMLVDPGRSACIFEYHSHLCPEN